MHFSLASSSIHALSHPRRVTGFVGSPPSSGSTILKSREVRSFASPKGIWEPRTYPLRIDADTPDAAATQVSQSLPNCTTEVFVMETKIHPIDRRTVNLETVAKELGVSRPVVYEAARRGELPVPVIRIGRRMVVSRQALNDLLARTKNEHDAA